MVFDFEKFPVYKEALIFVKDISDYLESLPSKENTRIIDQLQRASISITLNIAEGAGRFHKSDKRNFYVMSRGSVYECVACLQILLSKKLIQQEKYNSFYEILNDLARQLSALIK